MAAILALDVGDKRVGYAVSDPERRLATPKGVFERGGGKAEKELLKLLASGDYDLLLVGLPLGEKQQETAQSEKIRSFIRRIERRAAVSVVYVDESHSSLEAKQRLGLAANPDQAIRKKGVIDAMAASILLQTYIDSGS